MSLALINKLASMDKKVAFVNMPRLITKVQTIVSGDKVSDDSLRRTIVSLENADIAVFDDIGAGSMSK